VDQAPPPGPAAPELAIPPPPPPPPKRPARWPPLIGLLAVILFVTFGGYFFSGVPSGVAGEVEVGAPVEVGSGVTIQPAEGWSVEGRNTNPPGVRFTGGGNGFMDASIHASAGTAEEVVELYVSEYLETQSTQLSVGTVETLSVPGGPAAVVSYVGVFRGVDVTLEGEVIGILGPSDTSAVVDAWSQEALYASVREQVRAMADSVTFA
jgi:hypothetical protein